MKVNFVDLKKQYEDFDLDELISLIRKGSFVGGEELEIFEQAFARYNGTKYCVGVGSGTDALILILKSLGIGQGDEVIVPANTYIATAFAVSHVGATPVFVDPGKHTYVLNCGSELDKYVTKRTKAIIPVHLYGLPVHMENVIEFANKHSLVVIEDCAQAIGAVSGGKKVGSWGVANAFSFYPTKNLGGLGQGGAVVTDNLLLATTVRELGNVGRTKNSWFDYAHIGFNSRLDTINAKFLSMGLKNVDKWNSDRVKIAGWYDELLFDIPGVIRPFLPPPEGYAFAYAVFHLYEIKCDSKELRDGLKKFLEDKGISCALHYPVPCHRQPVYFWLNTYCPISDELSETLLSLPMHPNLTKDEVVYVCNSIKEFFNR